MAAVILDAVTFRYPGSRGETLEALSLVVPDKSTHALLGASGAGKTTVLNLLSGSLQPTSGSILLDGVEVSKLPSAQRNVTQVFQFPVLYPAMTVAENLSIGRGFETGLAGAIHWRKTRTRAAELIERFGSPVAELVDGCCSARTGTRQHIVAGT